MPVSAAGRPLELSGALPILPTVFDDTGAVDWPGMARVLEFIVGAGASGFVFPGLASEYETLSRAERLELTALVGEHRPDGLPFVVGASAPVLEDAIAYAQAGAQAGASVAMVLTPHAFAGDGAGMAAFYRTLYDEGGLPIMLQNAPAPMGVGLAIDAVGRLAREVEGVHYVKEEALPSGQRISGVMAAAGRSLEGVFGGAGGRNILDELARGAAGAMPACEITDVHVDMVRRWRGGDRDGARDLFERTLPLLSMQLVFRWRLTKAVLRRRGLIESEHVRSAGPALDRQDRMELEALLTRLADLLPDLAAPKSPGLAA